MCRLKPRTTCLCIFKTMTFNSQPKKKKIASNGIYIADAITLNKQK